MKINWGTGIAIAFVAFMTFILHFVYRSYQHSVDLVATDYYARELNFQSTIDARANAAGLKDSLVIERKSDAIVFKLPVSIKEPRNVVALFYRPANSALDRVFSLPEGESQMVVPLKNLQTGKYEVIISWSAGNKHFEMNKTIFI
ncbi:MAG: FixH family protein [Salibacteraceae bacterium]